NLIGSKGTSDMASSHPRSRHLNGAGSLVRTLLKSGVDTCFASPGTSEKHFVGAIDRSRVILSSEAAGSRLAEPATGALNVCPPHHRTRYLQAVERLGESWPICHNANDGGYRRDAPGGT